MFYHQPTDLEIRDRITQLTNVSEFKAENIARIESSKVSSAARLTSYRKESDFDNFLFDHIGPNDVRTTPTSTRIKARTKGGVPWSEYVKIVIEESAKDFPTWTVNPDYPVSHWNSRHTFIRRTKR